MTNDTELFDRARDTQHVSRAVNSRMLAKGWRPAELARRSGVGRDEISRLLNAQRLPGLTKLTAISQALGCTLAELSPHWEDTAPFAITQNPNNPHVARLSVNTDVPFSMMSEIMAVMARAQLELPAAMLAGQQSARRKSA